MESKDGSRGTGSFGMERNEEHLNAFIQTVSADPESANLPDSGFTGSGSLDEILRYLKESGTVDDLLLEPRQGDGQTERALFLSDKLPTLLRSVELTLEREKELDTKTLAELKELRETVLNVMRQSQYNYPILPAEVEIDIFSSVIDGSSDSLLTLNLVCRRWRNLILDTPQLWRRLSLERGFPQKMVDVWLERANGVITSLRMERGFEFRKRRDVFKKAPRDFWSKLEELEVDVASFDSLHPEIIPQLRLRRIALDSKPDFPRRGQWKGFGSLETSTIHHLAVGVSRGNIMLNEFPFYRLTTLELAGTFFIWHFFDLLQRNPSLEVLVVTHSPHLSIGTSGIEPIHLPHLRRVELSNLFTPTDILRRLRNPSLTTIKVHNPRTRTEVIWLQAILFQKITNLTEIVFTHCFLPYPHLLDLLRISDCLETLNLGSCEISEGTINDVIEGLCNRASDEGGTSSASIICPRLQCVDVSGQRDLEAGPLLRLVEAHLTTFEAGLPERHSSTSQSPDHSKKRLLPLPIFSLNIDNCPRIDSESLEWLRARVRGVSRTIVAATKGWFLNRWSTELGM